MGAFFYSMQHSSGMHDDAEGEADQHQHNGAQECWDEASNVKSRNEGAGQQQDDGVDHQKEKPQGQDAEREGQQFQQKSHGCVQEADNQGRDQRTAKAGQLKARHDISADQQRKGTEKPDKK